MPGVRFICSRVKFATTDVSYLSNARALALTQFCLQRIVAFVTGDLALNVTLRRYVVRRDYAATIAVTQVILCDICILRFQQDLQVSDSLLMMSAWR